MAQDGAAGDAVMETPATTNEYQTERSSSSRGGSARLGTTPPATPRMVSSSVPDDTAESNDAIGSEVWLHVYHCDPATGFLNWAFMKSFEIGIYHAGVEVYDEEWSFQYFEDTWDDPSIPGIVRCEPRAMPNYDYQESISLGRTSLPEAQVYRLIDSLYDDWPACSYHLTKHNCIHFAEYLSTRLKTPIPFPQTLKGVIDASNNSPGLDTVVCYGWSWARWWMEYKNAPPEVAVSEPIVDAGTNNDSIKDTARSEDTRCGAPFACCTAPRQPSEAI